jgi:hypothetical protein
MDNSILFTNILNLDSTNNQIIKSYSFNFPLSIDSKNISIPEETIIFPNPANNEFFIKTKEIPNRITIFNQEGQNTAIITPIDKISTINSSNLINGQYYIQIIFSNRIEHKKLMIFGNQ